MYVVIDAEFNPELHTIWGPFQNQQAATGWASKHSWTTGEYLIQEVTSDMETCNV